MEPILRGIVASARRMLRFVRMHQKALCHSDFLHSRNFVCVVARRGFALRIDAQSQRCDAQRGSAGGELRTLFIKRSRCFFDCAVLVMRVVPVWSSRRRFCYRQSTDLGEQHGEEGKEGKGEEGREEEGRREEAQVVRLLRRGRLRTSSKVYVTCPA
jgi:hypothetical protein